MARQTVATALDFLKEYMADPASDTWNASYASVVSLFNEAQDALNEVFLEYEIETLRLTTVVSVPAGTSALDRSTAPTYPDGMILPYKLWERPSGGNDNQWLLVDEREYLEPVATQGPAIGQWSWDEDKIRMQPCASIRDVRIEYEGFPANFTATTDPLPMEGSARCLALFAAMTAASARDQHAIADRFEARARRAAIALVRIQNRDEQHFPIVRRPYRPALSFYPFNKLRTP